MFELTIWDLDYQMITKTYTDQKAALEAFYALQEYRLKGLLKVSAFELRCNGGLIGHEEVC